MQIAQAKTAHSATNNKGSYIVITPWCVKPGSGVGNVILGLNSELCKSYATEIWVTGWQKPTPDQTWYRLHSARLPWRNLVAYAALLLPQMWRLRRRLRGVSVINAHYVGLELLPLAVLRRFGQVPRLIFSVHGSDVSDGLQSRGIERYLWKWLYASADVVVACSHALRNDVTQISPSARTAVVWNGISSPSEQSAGRPQARPYLVSVAGFVGVKGLDTLIDAFCPSRGRPSTT